MASDEAKITIRLPRELHTQLQAAAEEDRRSLNTMIVLLLEYGVAHHRATAKRTT